MKKIALCIAFMINVNLFATDSKDADDGFIRQWNEYLRELEVRKTRVQESMDKSQAALKGVPNYSDGAIIPDITNEAIEYAKNNVLNQHPTWKEALEEARNCRCGAIIDDITDEAIKDAKNNEMSRLKTLKETPDWLDIKDQRREQHNSASIYYAKLKACRALQDALQEALSGLEKKNSNSVSKEVEGFSDLEKLLTLCPAQQKDRNIQTQRSYNINADGKATITVTVTRNDTFSSWLRYFWK